MASPQILHTQSDSGSLPSDDFSFLPEVETIDVPNGDINHQNDCFNFTNMQSVLSGTSPDSIIEVHSQLGELIEENLHLKEQLHKNNSMMEDQINTIQSWRDHMLLSKNQLEENLKIAKEQISSLEKENSKLREKVDNLIKLNEKEDLKLCAQCTTHEADLNSEENLLDNLKFTCHYLEVIGRTSTDPEDVTILQFFISYLKNKMASLKDDVGHIDSLQTDEEAEYELVRLKTHESGIKQFHKVTKELMQKIQDKEKEVECLMTEKLELLQKIKEQEIKLQEMEANMKSQNEFLNNQLQNESSLSQKYKNRCESLQQQIEEYQVKLEESKPKTANDADIVTLREEVQQLQKILELEQRDKIEQEKKYSLLMKKCENLQVDYDRVVKLLEIQTKEDKEKSEQLSVSINDVKKYMEEVDHLTAKLLETEEKLEEKEEEVKRLREKILNQTSEDPDIISTLKTQIEVYKNDYHKLESDKNAASDEIERLKNELKKCKKHETSRSRNRRFSYETEENGATALIKCPVCDLGFSTEKEAETHIIKCIEDNS